MIRAALKLFIFLSIPALVVGAEATQGVRGAIACIDDGKSDDLSGSLCFEASRVFRLTPAPVDRDFVWAASDGSELILATVPANESILNVDDLGSRTVMLSVQPTEPPLPVTFRATFGVDGPPRQWAWTSSVPLENLRLVRVPPEAGELTISAPRHHETRLQLPPSSRPSSLGKIALTPYDRIEGRIIALENGAPIAGASIETLLGEMLASSAGDGSFDFDITPNLAAHWPSALHIHSPGRGSRVLELPEKPRGHTLEIIEMSAGGALRLEIGFPEAESDLRDVNVELLQRLGEGVDDWEPVARAQASPDEPSVSFEDLEEGSYAAIVAGREPLQKIAVDLEVKRATVTERMVVIDPVKVTILVTQSSTPVPEATVEVTHRSRWRAEVTTDEFGAFEGDLWQRGNLFALARAAGRGAFASRKSIGNEGVAKWLIDIPDRVLQGKVFERQTGNPVEGAVVVLDRQGAKRLTKSDEQGQYVFESLQEGPLNLRVLAKEALLGTNIDVMLSEADRVRTVDLPLERATLVRFRVLSSGGSPASKANIYDVTQPDVIFRTDERGEFQARLRAGETRQFAAVPQEGSFAIFEVALTPEDRQPIEVRVPPGPATLRVEAKSDNGEPISGITLRMRFNGIELPFSVMQWIASRDGRMVTGSDGTAILAAMPLGVYDVWPITNSSEARRFLPAGPAPIRFSAQPGDNPVRLTFTRR